ncbi:MAG: YlxR family protein [Firmicutes bacterium]|nr:YlxR family protein [Bacillota bacterium]
MRKRRVPQRMCVGCQQMKPKRELIRIVRTPEEEIHIDPTGKRSGRGAYICPRRECLELALKQKALGKALKTVIPLEIVESLQQELAEDERA